MEPSLTPIRMGTFFALAGLDDVDHLRAVINIARVQADLMNSGIECFESALKMEMDVRDNRHLDPWQYLAQRVGVLALRHGYPDEVGAGGGELIDLRHTCLDVVGIPAVID